MRNAVAVLGLLVFAAVPLGAQGRARSQGIPPGHLPPPGECRVWYDDRPPGRQPPPTSCRDAERIAARDRYARVIYGGDGYGRDDGWWGRDDRRGPQRPRAIPRGYPSRDRYPYPESRYPYPDRYPSQRGRDGYGGVAFDNGYRDGYDKGREDAQDRDGYDPVRHRRYRSADRGYERRYGSKDEYKYVYREGFQAGYDDGYYGGYDNRRERRGGIRVPWPF